MALEIDPELLQNALAGDRLAFQRVVDETWGLVFVFVRQRVNDPEASRDLAQDTFLKAFSKLDTLRQGQSFVSWLLAIAANKIIDHRRRQRARPEVALGDDAPELPANESGPSEFSERAGDVEGAMARLDDLYRTVLILRYWSGLTPAQIARLLGEPEGTIRNRIFRAHLRLREQLDRTDDVSSKASESYRGSSASTEGR